MRKLILILLVVFTFPFVGSAQDASTTDIETLTARVAQLEERVEVLSFMLDASVWTNCQFESYVGTNIFNLQPWESFPQCVKAKMLSYTNYWQSQQLQGTPFPA